MQFDPIASSSKGNAYLLRCNGSPPLLLEAGIPMAQLRKALYDRGMMISDIAGCLISHEHL